MDNEREWPLWLVLLIMAGILVFFYMFKPAHAHDHNRSNLNSWFSGLHSSGGLLCCDGTDIDTGRAKHVATEDWDVKDGHYRVRLDGQWIDVPDDAVIHTPNLYGETLVWPVYISGLSVTIRCFLPGAGT